VYGWPVVDTTKFPNLNATVAYVHQAGLKAGFYFNGCACGEPIERTINYAGDVAEASATNFDSFKLDSCGAQKNLSLYYELANASRPRHYLIENAGIRTPTHARLIIVLIPRSPRHHLFPFDSVTRAAIRHDQMDTAPITSSASLVI
jgi:hypothetical protein